MRGQDLSQPYTYGRVKKFVTTFDSRNGTHMYIRIHASRALGRDGVGESVEGDSADAAHESRRRSNKTVHNARSVPRIAAERGESKRGGTAAQPPLACGGSLTESAALEPRHKRASTLQQARAAHFFA